jgi:hypothetical protein
MDEPDPDPLPEPVACLPVDEPAPLFAIPEQEIV